MTDQELIEQHRQGSADAFAALVRRHVDWIYSAASRRMGDAHLAEDVTQAVFTTLASKRPYTSNGSLSPWLFGVLIRTCKVALKRQATRRRHETEAARMRPQTLESPANAEWSDIAPHLEEMVNKLRTSDREIVLLRFYEQKSFAEIAEMIGITEDAARKRVSRSVEALRGMLSRRGVSMPAAALGAVLAAEIVKPAPAAIAASFASGSALTAAASSKSALLLLTTPYKLVAAAVLVVLVGGWIAIFSQLSDERRATRADSSAPTSLPSTQPARQPRDEVIARLEQIAKGFDENSIRSQDWWFKGRVFIEQKSAPGATAPNSYIMGPEWREFSYVQKHGKRRFEIAGSPPGAGTIVLKSSSMSVQFHPNGRGFLEIYPAQDEAAWLRLINSYGEFAGFDFDRTGTDREISVAARELIAGVQAGDFEKDRRIDVSADGRGEFTIRLTDTCDLSVFKIDGHKGFNLSERTVAHHQESMNIDLTERREFKQMPTGQWVLSSAVINTRFNSVAGERRVVVDEVKFGQFDYPDEMFDPASLAIPTFVNTYDYRFSPRREFNNPHAHEQVSTELLLKTVVKPTDTSAIFGLTEDMKEEPMDEETARALQEFMDQDRP
jgi:RNA polymerase sigma factor (sigma-70 family)